MPRRRLIAPVLLLMMTAVAAPAQRVTLTYRGCARVADPTATGLSGIAYDGREYWAVLDNSDQLVRLDIRLGGDGTIASAVVVKHLTLADRSDFEGVALTGRGTTLVSDETPPTVREYRLTDGVRVAALPVPPVFRDIVPNQGFESLALTPDRKTLWTANERSLKRDGNPQVAATPMLSATRVRLLKYEWRDGGFVPVAQYEYDTSGVHDWGGQIGLSDLVALPDGRLLALERSAAMNFWGVASIRTRVFLADTRGATDISTAEFDTGLVNKTPTPVRKTLLFDGFVCSENGENLEGLCLGPPLGRNRWAILGVVDSTDGPLRLSKSSVVAFELNLNAPPPATTRSAAPTSQGTP